VFRKIVAIDLSVIWAIAGTPDPTHFFEELIFGVGIDFFVDFF
jgi:hypothetical protein